MNNSAPVPVHEDVRAHVWQCLLDIFRLVYYYESLEERHKKARNLTRFVLFFSATGEVALVLSATSPKAQIVLALLIGLAVAVEAWLDYPDKLTALQMTGNQCRRLRNEWESLWLKLNTERVETQAIREENDALRDELEEAVSWARQAKIKVYKNLNQESYITANKVVEDRFAQAHS